MNDREMESLVEVIAKRVESELAARAGKPRAGASAPGGSASSASANAPCGACATDAPCSHVAPLIDHTLLKPEATRDELRKLCEEARKYGFATVCVNSANVRQARAFLEGSQVKAIAVVGFPLGAGTSGAKSFETREAIRNGAQEIDMVINIGELKSKNYAFVLEDMRAVVAAAGAVPVKVILETSKLERDEKVIACALAKAAGAAFVKTSTGFGGGGATVEDVALMRQIVGDDVGVKASGGIRTIDDAERMVEAGANRLGASSSVAIVHCVREGAQPANHRGRRPTGSPSKGY